ncbi:MAG: hypothetical protein Q4E83_00420 [bacterium]|nr:hypothetical protein [bacterium]
MQVQSVSNVQNLGFAKNYSKIGNSIAKDIESAPIQEASSENYRANFAPNFKSRRVQPKYVYNLKESYFVKEVLDFAKTQTKDYEKVVDNIVNSKHDIVRLLMDAKDSEGLRLLNAEEVSDVLYKCKNVIDENPKLFKAVLKNPEEIAFISSLESKSDGIFKAVKDALNPSSQMIK